MFLISGFSVSLWDARIDATILNECMSFLIDLNWAQIGLDIQQQDPGFDLSLPRLAEAREWNFKAWPFAQKANSLSG